MKRVTVLLSSYNGEKYLNQQLQSLYKQRNVSVSILVRDDGSTDSTIKILRNEELKGNLHVIEGNNIGFCKSFWSLVMVAPESDYYAFCDQDDFWMPDKLERAINMLDRENASIPLLYTSNVIPVDENLNKLDIKTFAVNSVFSYAMSLRCPALPGCTFVFNRTLIDVLRKYQGFLRLHDWTTYTIAAGMGKVFFDSESSIMYRQHGNNALGVDSKVEKIKHKFERFFRPKYVREKSKVAEGIYESYKSELSDENKKLTEAFAFYYKDIRYVFFLLKYREYRNPSFIVQLLLKKI